MATDIIHYEFPLAERIRTLLRLEDLFGRLHHFLARQDPHDHHICILLLFELIEVASRADVKTDLMQELERQRQALENLRSNPHISEAALDAVLNDIETVSARIHEMTGKVGQHIRDSEWLMSIKQRTTIPGGVCQFDLPSYHFWLNQAAHIKVVQILAWLDPIMPLKDGLDIVLRLLRESAKTSQYTARQGGFQQMSGGKHAQLIRIGLDKNLPCVPELSANKYAINIRFMDAFVLGERAKQYPHDVDFHISYCHL